MDSRFLLEIKNIDKSFPGVQALRDVSMNVLPGEVHAVVGENGAGKSTLMNILSGAYCPDNGHIFLDRREVRITNPRVAQELGINIVHQELTLFPNLSVAENIFVGRIPSNGGFVNSRQLRDKTAELLPTFGLSLSPEVLARDLSVASQQLVEILRAIRSQCKILILDEPTSALANHETSVLFGLIRRLKEGGVSIIYVSHRLHEIFDIADTITVLRDGAVTGIRARNEISEDELVRLMVGRSLESYFPEKGRQRGIPLLGVENLTLGETLRNISFELHRGEILGISGLAGAGRSELARCIVGAQRFDSGTISLDGRPVRIDSPQRAAELEIGYLPEDRKLQGLFLRMSLRRNVVAAILKRLSNKGIIDSTREKSLAAEAATRLSIKSTSIEARMDSLSGGNQQKVMLARWLLANPRVLIIDEPTRGIDVGAKAEIHALLRKLANEGIGIIMISSELPEILGMSDRVLVMYEGSISGQFHHSKATEERIMACAVGRNPEASIEGK
jgi:ribose transport system ATP-binding protein